MNVFIAGPRAISVLDEKIESRLNNIMANNLTVLVGDASGIDKAIQVFFASRDYRNVEVFASNGRARNNMGNWFVHSVPVDVSKQGFDFYAAKDLAMVQDADYGFMIWNGESRGTLNNIINLTSFGKRTVLYFWPGKDFYTINTFNDIDEILVHCPTASKELYKSLRAQKLPPVFSDSLCIDEHIAIMSTEEYMVAV
jgi:hypothetical protein